MTNWNLNVAKFTTSKGQPRRDQPQRDTQRKFTRSQTMQRTNEPQMNADKRRWTYDDICVHLRLSAVEYPAAIGPEETIVCASSEIRLANNSQPPRDHQPQRDTQCKFTRSQTMQRTNEPQMNADKRRWTYDDICVHLRLSAVEYPAAIGPEETIFCASSEIRLANNSQPPRDGMR